MKKKIPLTILNALEEYVSLKDDLFKVAEPEKYLLKIIDEDENSGFHFIIESYNAEKEFKVLANIKPVAKNDVAGKRIWIKGEEIRKYFANWKDILEEYNEVNSFYDDPIVKTFANEYYNDFQVLDEDADVNPFSINQILLLDNHLENIEKNIEKHETDFNTEEIAQIKKESSELRTNLTSKSKVWVLKKLAGIWGKITKQGIGVFKEFVAEGKKTLIKQGVNFLIDYVTG